MLRYVPGAYPERQWTCLAGEVSSIKVLVYYL